MKGICGAGWVGAGLGIVLDRSGGGAESEM